MYTYLKQFLAFIIASLGLAIAETAVDELATQVARKRHQHNSKTRQRAQNQPPIPKRISSERVQEILAEFDSDVFIREARRQQNKRTHEQNGNFYGPANNMSHQEFMTSDLYHDVILVAFDLTGPSGRLTQEWLFEQLPTGDTVFVDEDFGKITLDSWWVANDERYDGSDCDSAVFVPKGMQEAARHKLFLENSTLDGRDIHE